jgi:hypothetical protein
MEPRFATQSQPAQQNLFFEKLKTLETNNDFLVAFINILTPYLICDHFIATEIRQTLREYTHTNGVKETFNSYINYQFGAPGNLRLEATDILQTRNLSVIKTGDIVKVQVDCLNFFLDEVLPWLEMTQTRIILMTGQYHLPAMKKGIISEILLRHPNILLWICENPIYNERENHKFMAFPFGFCHTSIFEYMTFIKTTVLGWPSSSILDKPNKIINTPSGVHRHLPPNHIRRTHPIFGAESGARISYAEYLTRISNAKFVMSPTGDRDDCHRHYESIGLGAIPISNISEPYLPIFANGSIVKASADEMAHIYINQKLPEGVEYKLPSADILMVDYWLERIRDRLSELGHKGILNKMK